MQFRRAHRENRLRQSMASGRAMASGYSTCPEGSTPSFSTTSLRQDAIPSGGMVGITSFIDLHFVLFAPDGVRMDQTKEGDRI